MLGLGIIVYSAESRDYSVVLEVRIIVFSVGVGIIAYSARSRDYSVQC